MSGYFKYDETGIDNETARKFFGIDFHPRYTHAQCYATYNRYAYLYDKNGVEPLSESKGYNFVPTYDKWCLYCNNIDCELRCSRCKFVYFCGIDCQRAAWPIHKRHCGRDLFTLCIVCGKKVAKPIECPNCPVKFCGKECYDKMFREHSDIDCAKFSPYKTT